MQPGQDVPDPREFQAALKHEDGLVHVPLARGRGGLSRGRPRCGCGGDRLPLRPDRLFSVGNASGELAKLSTAPDPPDAGKHDRKAGLARTLRAQMALKCGHVPPEEV